MHQAVFIRFAVICWIALVKAETPVISPESRLHDALGLRDERKYDPEIRPTNSSNSTLPTVVKLWFRLQHIYDVEEKERSLFTNVELIQRWHDENLMWNPDDYEGIKHIIVFSDNVWTPDIIVHNSLGDTSMRLNSFFGGGSEMVRIRHDGIVTRKPSYLLYTMCQFSIRYFPYDNHLCYFFVRSMHYDITILRLETQKFPQSLLFNTLFDVESEWDLMAMSSQQSMIDDENGQFDTAFIGAWIIRKPLFYMVNITIPSVILIILTAASYLLPIESGERVGIGLTVLLSFTVFILVVAESVPKTSQETPLLTYFLTLAMFSNLQSVIWTIICTRYWIRPPREQHHPGICGSALLKLRKFIRISHPESICKCESEVWSHDVKQADGERTKNGHSAEEMMPNDNTTNVFNKKHDCSKQVTPVLCNWHLILEIIDRVFFIVTVLLQVVAFVVMVIVMPLNDRNRIYESVQTAANYNFIDFVETYG